MLNYFFVLGSSFSYEMDQSSMPIIFNSTDGPIFVEIWDPWCPHCKRFKNSWTEITNLPEFSNVTFATVKCTGMKLFCKKFPGNETPRFFWYDNSTSESKRYSGAPVYDEVVAFINQQLNGPLIEINYSKNYEEVTNEMNEHWKKVHRQAAFIFNISKNDVKKIELVKKAVFEIKHLPVILFLYLDESQHYPVLSTYGPTFNVLHGSFTKENIQDFIRKRSVVHLSIYTDMTAFYSEVQKIPVCVFVRPNFNKEYNVDESAAVTNYYFATTQTTCKFTPSICKYVWEKTTNTTGFVAVLNRSERNFWVLREPYTKERLNEWAKSISNHTLKPYGPGPSKIGSIINVYYSFREIGGFGFYAIHMPIIASSVLILILLYVLIELIADEVRSKYYKIRRMIIRRRLENQKIE